MIQLGSNNEFLEESMKQEPASVAQAQRVRNWMKENWDGFGPEEEPSAPQRILLVDDDPAMLTVLDHMIKHINPNVRVDCAQTGEEAETLLKYNQKAGEVPYDLAMVDVILPGRQTGFDLWQELDHDFPATQVVLMSGRPISDYYKAFGKDVICPPYLQKPIYQMDVRSVLDMAA